MGNLDNQYQETIDRAIVWLRAMLVTPDGSAGVYERYRINLKNINPWVRPDCSIEVGTLFHAHGSLKNDPEQTDIGLRLADFVLSLQRHGNSWLDGSFPFYVFRPTVPDERDIGDDFGIPDLPEYAWPNDNGKIVTHLLQFYERTLDARFLLAAQQALAYLMRIQAQDGAFSLTKDGDAADLKGADFVARPSLALVEAARITDKRDYYDCALRGLRWLNEHRVPSGRSMTSYETARTEAWRPPSSETAITLLTFARAAHLFSESWVYKTVEELGSTVLRWMHTSGAIRNCDADSITASLQNDPNVTDLIYTDGYALLALQEAYIVTQDTRFLQAATKLADFLASIQCRSESDAWDGSWRGSYHLEKREWFGTADQENPLDEGGMYTAYTGWSAAPIAHGLLRLDNPTLLTL